MTADPNGDARGNGPQWELPTGENYGGTGGLPAPEELLLEHDSKINRLQADIEGLAGAVADLFAAPPRDTPAPWNWKELDGPDSAALLTGLRHWVDWYNDRYGVAAESRIPGCWYRHGPVVEELTAVWVAWQAAYYGHKTPNDAPAYWHERILWPTINRIKKGTWGFSACTPTHKDPRPKNEPSTDHGFTAFTTNLKPGQDEGTSMKPATPSPEPEAKRQEPGHA